MKTIFGLGNPGLKYKHNRHNVGYLIIDELIRRVKKNSTVQLIHFSAAKIKAKIAEEYVLLIKPETFMNNSGIYVKKVINTYKMTIDDCLIIYDDISLPLGVVRFRKKGSSGGHNGMNSIIESLETDKINRLRIGIGKNIKLKEQPDITQYDDLAEYVLSDFSIEEKTIFNNTAKISANACIDWIKSGSEYVMNKYNKSH